jgi:hypothetical protein
MLVQERTHSSKADNLQITQTYDIWSESEERSVDCPDCFDTMVKVSNYDKVRYQCENCDLVIPEMRMQQFYE